MSVFLQFPYTPSRRLTRIISTKAFDGIMDTDFLSEEAYGIILCAGNFDDTLQTLLGAACSECKDEEEYLKHISEIISEIKTETMEYLEDWGLEDTFSVKEYRQKLKTLEAEIQKVIKIPLKARKSRD